MEYLADQNKLVINFNYSDNSSLLYEAPLSTDAEGNLRAECTQIAEYPNGDRYGFLLYPFNYTNPAMPGQI